MRKETIEILMGKIDALIENEIKEKLRNMMVNENKDGLRLIFEFEFKGRDLRNRPDIHDAVEIRHRRPWR